MYVYMLDQSSGLESGLIPNCYYTAVVVGNTCLKKKFYVDCFSLLTGNFSQFYEAENINFPGVFYNIYNCRHKDVFVTVSKQQTVPLQSI